MRLEISVGDSDSHRVVYTWDQMWGGITVSVDGVRELATRAIFGARLNRDATVTVGEHIVVFRKTRPLLAAGFRPQTVTAYVDGEEVARKTEGLTREQVPSIVAIGVITALVVILIAVGVPTLLTHGGG